MDMDRQRKKHRKKEGHHMHSVVGIHLSFHVFLHNWLIHILYSCWSRMYPFVYLSMEASFFFIVTFPLRYTPKCEADKHINTNNTLPPPMRGWWMFNWFVFSRLFVLRVVCVFSRYEWMQVCICPSKVRSTNVVGLNVWIYHVVVDIYM